MTTIDSVPARSVHKSGGLVSAILLGIIAVSFLPSATEPWGIRPWFPALYLSGIFILASLTATFLALQVFAGAPSRMLAWVSGGYAFTALLALAQFLTFPGLLDLHGSGDAATWLWIYWHAGFPCFVLLAVGTLLKAQPPNLDASRRRYNLFPLAVGIFAALVGGLLLIRFAASLPVITHGNDYRDVTEGFEGGALVVLNLFALGALITRTRLRELISVWLALALFAFTLDVILSIAAMARYTAGWYIARGLSLMSSAALMVALLIEHYQLHLSAEIRAAFHEQEALHDPLTGVFNRRYLMTQLAYELGRAQRYGYPVSVLLLDVDHFKNINDRYGHAKGDECLRGLARALDERKHRQADFFARYGGEEFVMVLPETGITGAVEVAEEIRLRIETLYTRGLVPCPMTASIGVSTTNSTIPASVEALLAEADTCLYRAKQQGRNCVVWPQKAGPPISEMPSLA